MRVFLSSRAIDGFVRVTGDFGIFFFLVSVIF